MTTHDRDKVIEDAIDAGLFSSIPVPQLLSIERFYAIAHEAGRLAEREETAKTSHPCKQCGKFWRMLSD